MSEHALLSPSGASRWMACTPSARMEELFEDSGSEFAREGSLAHAIAEAILRSFFGVIGPAEADKILEALRNDPLYSPDMDSHVNNYVEYVVSEFEKAKELTPDALLFIEKKLDLTRYIPDSFGTGDAIIIADGTMRIIDLKYGKGVRVSAVNNKQMMLYALGALDEFDFIYDIRNVIATIYQPRMENISDFEISAAELHRWGKDELAPKAKLAYNGHGELVPGEHCKFCKAKVRCKALADKNNELAAFEFMEANLISDEDIAAILSAADLYKNWINAVEDYAFKQALEGKQWPGYKLVEGRSVRQYVDQDQVASKLVSNGIPEAIIYEKKLLGITAMEKAITKKTFESLLSDLVVKPSGKPTLVPETDKRPVWSSNTAADDFAAISDFEDLV